MYKLYDFKYSLQKIIREDRVLVEQGKERIVLEGRGIKVRVRMKIECIHSSGILTTVGELEY